MLPLTLPVAGGLGPPEGATWSTIKNYISLQGHPALCAFLSRPWTHGGERAGLGAEGPAPP